MSALAMRALALMAQDARAIMARLDDGYGVYPNGDRRRRPRLRLSLAQARLLEADGAVAELGDAFVLADAGAKRAAREAAPKEETFLAQHGDLAARAVMDAHGRAQAVRGFVQAGAVARLARVKDGDGRAWFEAAELAAAERLRLDWEAGQSGLVRTSDWSAPPRSGAGRGAGNSAEYAMSAGLDARRRVEDALAQLAPPLRRVVERVCFHEDGLEKLERMEGWPARSAKLALKFALAQLAQRALS